MISKIFLDARSAWNIAAAAFETQVLIMRNYFLLLLIALLFTHCTSSKANHVSSDTNYASSDLVGTWKINSYSVNLEDGTGMKVSEVGKITFRKDGTGERFIEAGIPVLAVEYGTYPFKWKQQDTKYIVISGDESNFCRTWEKVSATKETYQLSAPLKENAVQLMELKQ